MLKTSAAPVAVFDSGIGGIGVLRELKKALPHENFLYFGDTANAPYGTREREEILALVQMHAARLRQKAKALVLACNTATAVAAAALRERYRDFPIIGIEPAVKPAALSQEHPTVLVLATPTTLQGQGLAALQAAYGKNAAFIGCAAPELVRLIEDGHFDDEQTAAYLKELLPPQLHGTVPDAVVLGCTHFPFAKAAISRFLGGVVPFFDGASGTARETARRLTALGLCNKQAKHGTVLLQASDRASLALMQKLL